MTREVVEYAEWERALGDVLREDPVWRMKAYRLAAYAADVGWADSQLIKREWLTGPVAPQLYRALGSIGANLAEGYSRSSGKDRVRLFEYALGSARESRHWYRVTRPVLGETTMLRRHCTLNEIVHLLLATIPAERRRSIRPKS